MVDILTVLGCTEEEIERFNRWIRRKRPVQFERPLPRSDGPAYPANLATLRWYDPILDEVDVPELVLRAQAGDKLAWDMLLRSFHRKILRAAARHSGRQSQGARLFDDLVAAGSEALWLAVLRYTLDRGSFTAYAQKCIAGAVSKEAKSWRNAGRSGETRRERWLSSHPHASAEDLVAASETELKLKRKRYHSLQEAAEEIKRVNRWGQRKSYSESYSDDIGVAQRPAKWHQMYTEYDFFNPHQFAPHLGPAACGDVSELLRSAVDVEPTTTMNAKHRFLLALAVVGLVGFLRDAVTADGLPENAEQQLLLALAIVGILRNVLDADGHQLLLELAFAGLLRAAVADEFDDWTEDDAENADRPREEKWRTIVAQRNEELEARRDRQQRHRLGRTLLLAVYAPHWKPKRQSRRRR
jgi:hypothetical protein